MKQALIIWYMGLGIAWAQSPDVMKTVVVTEGFSYPTPKIKYWKPVLQVGSGAFFYTGSMRMQKQFGRQVHPGFGLQIGLEQRIGKYIGIQNNLIWGHVNSEIQSTHEFKNFKTRVLSGDIRLALHFDLISSKKSSVAPFFNIGAGWLNISSKSDIRNDKNEIYYAWEDGTLRPEAQVLGNAQAPILERDYVYESDVTPPLRNMPQLVGELGVKFKILNFWDIILSYSHFYSFGSFTGYSGKEEQYGLAKLGLNYYFGQIRFKKNGGEVTEPKSK